MGEVMLDVLARAEQALPELLRSLEGWNTLDVDYEPPRVERLWRSFEDCRLYLHRIHPCQTALYHPHPWPSAIKIVAGGYEMAVGFGEGEKAPPIAATLKLVPGSSYEMTNIDGWHYVLPTVMNLSIMVTGAPWARWAPGPDPAQKLGPLSETDALRLLHDFQAIYSGALYADMRPGWLLNSSTAARYIDSLRRNRLYEQADRLQFDDNRTCRLCGTSTTVGVGHKCWSYWEGQVAWHST